MADAPVVKDVEYGAAPLDALSAEREPEAASLWRDGAFLTFWGGQSLSLFGTQITQFALPWLVLDLTRSALGVGLLSAAGFLPSLFFAMPAGMIVDRWNRRSVMLVGDVARAVLVLSIPAAYAMGNLTLGHLVLVAVLMRLCMIFFDVGASVCLPSLVGRRQRADASGKMEISRTAADLAGQPIAGTLVALLTATGALMIDGVSSLVSAVSLCAIRQPPHAPHGRRARGTVWRGTGQGLRFVWGQPLIRALTVVTAIGNLATSAVLAVLVYRARIELHAGPIQTGIVLAGAAVGQFLATPLAEATARRLPPGRNMLLATILQPIFPLALALTGQIGAMAGIAICWGAAVTFLNIPSITLRRALIPDHLLSRTASAIRLIAWSGVPLGALFGGLIAGDYGARVTFACAAAALALGIAYVVVSPIPRADTPHSRG